MFWGYPKCQITGPNTYPPPLLMNDVRRGRFSVRLQPHTRATLEPQPVQRPENSSPGFQPGLWGHFSGERAWMGWLGEGVGLPPATSHTARLGPWGSLPSLPLRVIGEILGHIRILGHNRIQAIHVDIPRLISANWDIFYKFL